MLCPGAGHARARRHRPVRAHGVRPVVRAYRPDGSGRPGDRRRLRPARGRRRHRAGRVLGRRPAGPATRPRSSTRHRVQPATRRETGPARGRRERAARGRRNPGLAAARRTRPGRCRDPGRRGPATAHRTGGRRAHWLARDDAHATRAASHSTRPYEHYGKAPLSRPHVPTQRCGAARHGEQQVQQADRHKDTRPPFQRLQAPPLSQVSSRAYTPALVAAHARTKPNVARYCRIVSGAPVRRPPSVPGSLNTPVARRAKAFSYSGVDPAVRSGLWCRHRDHVPASFMRHGQPLLVRRYVHSTANTRSRNAGDRSEPIGGPLQHRSKEDRPTWLSTSIHCQCGSNPAGRVELGANERR